MKPAYPYALPYIRYRELMEKDFSRLLELTRSAEGRLAAQVPGCPEWDVEALVRHTALVYLQKAETIRTGVKPQGRWVPEEILQLGPVEILETCFGRLSEEFDSHEPADVAESWVVEDQTVGFWIRRLAHETAIHRYDIEAALGRPQPIDADLALDGIDEVLTVMLGRGTDTGGSKTGTVVLESEGFAWTAYLQQDGVTITGEGIDSPDAHIAGEPNTLLLWLWGREPLPDDGAIQPTAAELRRRLAADT
ncbi:maleylpyruvate isomerase family mycothiol-dependent enzyme [Arthrobacter tecti]